MTMVPPELEREPPSADAAAGISIQNITVEYSGGKAILRDLEAEIAPGEIVALVGASGCGKSTLLRAIANLIDISAGQIEFHSGSPSRRAGDLAYVFQDATLLPWRTVFENAILPLELMRSESRRRRSAVDSFHPDRVAENLRAVGLTEDAWQKFPRELSGGMKMRTSIARALVTDPSVMLLDEPFAALDDLLRSRLNDLILDLWQQRSRTILFVTHNIAEAVYMSHRIAILHDGKIAKMVENRVPWPRQAAQRRSLAFAEQYGVVSEAMAEVVPGE